MTPLPPLRLRSNRQSVTSPLRGHSISRFHPSPLIRVLSVVLCGLLLPLAARASEASVPAPPPGRVRLIALLPGAVVHGLGHMYAGDRATARFLFVSETVGYAAMFTAASGGSAPLEKLSLRSVAFGAGAALFVGSWAYDVLESPAVARDRRRAAGLGQLDVRVGSTASATGHERIVVFMTRTF